MNNVNKLIEGETEQTLKHAKGLVEKYNDKLKRRMKLKDILKQIFKNKTK